jgi:hypothetical protein
MMATSKDESAREEVATPRLETRRRNEAAAEADSRQSIAQHVEPEAPDANVAVYLIEREAIQLRRLRWATPAAVTTEPADGETLQRAIPPDIPLPPESLGPYARPEPSSSDSKQADDAISRLLRWLQQIFTRE